MAGSEEINTTEQSGNCDMNANILSNSNRSNRKWHSLIQNWPPEPALAFEIFLSDAHASMGAFFAAFNAY